MSFAERFAAGQQIAQGLIDTYQTSAQQKKFSDIDKAKVEEEELTPATVYGATPPPELGLRKPIESRSLGPLPEGGGPAPVGTEVAPAPTTMAPSAYAAPAEGMKPRKTYRFMGQTFDEAPDQAKMDRLKAGAYADAISSRDPARGLEMRRALAREDRDEKAFAVQQRRNERTDKREADDDAKREALKGIDTQLAESVRARLTGPDGKQRPMTPSDQMSMLTERVGMLMGGGYVAEATEATKERTQMALNQITMDKGEREAAFAPAAMAAASGDYGPIGQFYDRFVPDGATVKGVSTDDKGQIVLERTTDDGKPLQPMTFKDQNHFMAVLNTLNDPKSLAAYADNEFKRNMMEADYNFKVKQAGIDNGFKAGDQGLRARSLDETIRHHKASEANQAADTKGRAASARAQGTVLMEDPNTGQTVAMTPVMGADGKMTYERAPLEGLRKPGTGVDADFAKIEERLISMGAEPAEIQAKQDSFYTERGYAPPSERRKLEKGVNPKTGQPFTSDDIKSFNKRFPKSALPVPKDPPRAGAGGASGDW